MIETIRKFLNPSTRKVIYSLGAAVFALLVTLGVIDATTSGQWLDILDRVLALGGFILAIANVNDEDEVTP